MPRKDGAPARARYDDDFKRRVLAEIARPGASVAGVARRHGLNANVVFRWRGLARFKEVADEPFFLPVTVNGPSAARVAPVAASAEPRWLHIELATGGRISCLEDIGEAALGRVVEALRRAA